MKASQLVESYKFWDIVELWSRDVVLHESVIAKALARGIIRDGLRFQSKDPKWVKAKESLRGAPYVGYSPTGGGRPVLLKSEVLGHLLHVVNNGADVSRKVVWEEYIDKESFRDWLEATEQALPDFWYE